MGVVGRQAFKRSTLAYAGAIIGVASQIWIYPLAFDIYGEYQFLLSMVGFILPFASLGVISLIIRFFPYFEDSNRGGGFLMGLIVAAVLAFVLFGSTVYVLRDAYYKLIELLDFDIEVFKRYNYIILLGSIFSIIGYLLSEFAANHKRIVIPYFFSHLLWKILLPILIILAYLGYIGDLEVYQSIYLVNILICVGLFLYVRKIAPFKIRISKKDIATFRTHLPSMLGYMSYGVFASIGSVLAFNIDKIMIRGYSTNYETGVYASMLVLSGLILYPYDSFINITGPLVSKAWKTKDYKKLNELNRDTCNVLTFIAVFIFFLIYLNLDDLLKMSSNYEGYKTGISAFFYLGIAKVVDSLFGLNAIILGYSKYFYYAFISTLLLAISNVYLNMTLIPVYGMEGAAISTLVAIALSNLFYYFFNWGVFKIQGLTVNVLLVVVILGASYMIANMIDISYHWVYKIVLRSVVFVGLSIPMIVYLRLSPQLNTTLNKYLNRSF